LGEQPFIAGRTQLLYPTINFFRYLWAWRSVRATANATEATAPEATEAATAATAHVAGTATHGYEATREAAMAAFAKSWRREN
jgi:hypothetical protein